MEPAKRPPGAPRAPSALVALLLGLGPACAPLEPKPEPQEPPPAEREAANMAAVPAVAPVRPTDPPVQDAERTRMEFLDRLIERARREGSVRVMVEIRQPERELDVETIRVQQDRFLDALASSPSQDERELTRFDRIPYLALELTAQDLQTLKQQGPDFLNDFGIGLDVPLFEKAAPASAGDYSLEQVAGFLQADDASAAGYDGSGQTIVLIDTGLDPEFYLLQERVTGGSFQSTGLKLSVCAETGETAWRGPAEFGAVDPPAAGLSHGTQVATVAIGADDVDATLRGIAPGATVVSIRLDDAEGIPTSLVVQAVLEVLCYWGGKSDHSVAAVSISLGSEDVYACPCGTDKASLLEISEAAGAMRFAIALLAKEGIPVVIGAGNDGADGMSFPACLEQAVSVVATEGDTDKLTWSNWDAAADLAAPGATILVPREGAGTMLGLGPGTSIAAPAVAGAIAVLRGAFPDCETEVILEALRASSVTLPSSTAYASIPLVQIEEARAYLDEVCGTTEPEPEPEPEPGPGSTVSTVEASTGSTPPR